MIRWAVALAAVAIGGAPAHADDGLLHELATQVRGRLEDASRERIPKPVPPVRVPVAWKADRVDSIELGAPLVALTGADLNGDGKAELYAVTPREVIVIGVTGKRAKELARFPFAGDAAVPQPRDVVGAAFGDAGAVFASTSGWARGMRISWNGKTLVADPGQPGFELCPGVTAQLAPGRNYFADQTYAVRCRELVDAAGLPVKIRATLAVTGKLEVATTPCAQDGTCEPAKTFEYPNAGVAFDVADVDRDGVPEVIYASSAAPGDGDTVRVAVLGGKVALVKAFMVGAVAGVAVADLDGNKKDDVIVAVRVAGAKAIDLWRLD